MTKPKRLKIVGNFSSVLIIRLNDIGEVVMTLPCLDAVRHALPGARIGFLVSPPSHELLLHDSRVDQIFVFEKKLWRDRPSLQGIKQLGKLLLDLHRERFDLAIDLHNNPSTHWLAYVSGARYRVSLDSKYRSRYLMTWKAAPCAGWEQMHNIERHFHVLTSVGIPTRGAEYRFALDPESRMRVKTQLDQELEPGKPVVVLQPGAGLPERCWPVQRFGELAARLVEEAGAQIVVHCGPGEDHLGERIRQSVPQPVLIAKRLTLQELAGLLDLCDLLISNDSGPMHLAAALGKPVVAVFGPTHPQRSGPYQARSVAVSNYVECSPCGIQNLSCIHRKCLTDISADEVYDAAVRVLSRERDRPQEESSGIASAGAS